jgi:hypothetical protein
MGRMVKDLVIFFGFRRVWDFGAKAAIGRYAAHVILAI